MGTTDLYAGIDIRTGKVITSLAQTHATPAFLRLMNKVVVAYPRQKVHVILDNASVHLSKDTEEWLAKQRGRVVFHFTSTGASWMNQIEIWTGERYHHPEGDPVRHVQLREGAYVTRRSSRSSSTGTATVHPSYGRPPRTRS